MTVSYYTTRKSSLSLCYGAVGSRLPTRLRPWARILGVLATATGTAVLVDQIRRGVAAPLVRMSTPTSVLKEPVRPVLPVRNDGLRRLLSNLLLLGRSLWRSVSRQSLRRGHEVKGRTPRSRAPYVPFFRGRHRAAISRRTGRPDRVLVDGRRRFLRVWTSILLGVLWKTWQVIEVRVMCASPF